MSPDESRSDEEPPPALDRRGFLRRVGRSAAGGWLALASGGAGASTLLSACSGDGGLTGTENTGTVRGSVFRVDGGAWTDGRVYLMRESGLQTGRYSELASDGSWSIPGVPAGEWQVAFHGPAHVEHDRASNPRRVSVPPGGTVEARFPVHPEERLENMIEIYIGDDFFQEQPLGEPNAPTTVELGTAVCWYNVSKVDHEVRGGPWDSSGVMAPTDSFIWDADQVGEFPYQCAYHSTEQKSRLIVEERGSGSQG